MGAAIPVITGVLGIVNLIQGIRAQSQQMTALSQATQLQQGQAAELTELQGALKDPNNPLRRALRAEAEGEIGRATSVAGSELVSDLASRGLRAPETIAGPLGAIARTGVTAVGDLERRLINDYYARRAALATPGGSLIGAGAGLAGDYGDIAGASGGALGRLLSLLQGGGGGGFKWPSWLTNLGGPISSSQFAPAVALSSAYGGSGGTINSPKLL